MNAIRTLFLGSNWESLETLKTLLTDKRFEVVGVITQPDKPSGRKQILTPTLVKTYALENSVEVFHTENKEEKYKEAFEKFKPDLVVVKAFGEKIPPFFIDAPKYKCINTHFSILPKYRGSIPTQMAILNGDIESGISYMKMAYGWDDGDILKISTEKILPDDTSFSLRKRLVDLAARELPTVLIDWIEGKIKPTPQDHSKAVYCYQKDISKEKAQINFAYMDAVYIDRFVRALTPWPVAWCIFDNKRMKVLKAKVSDLSYIGEEMYKVVDKKLILKTKSGFIEFLEVQMEGKNPIPTSQFINSLN